MFVTAGILVFTLCCGQYEVRLSLPCSMLHTLSVCAFVRHVWCVCESVVCIRNACNICVIACVHMHIRARSLFSNNIKSIRFGFETTYILKSTKMSIIKPK